MTTVGPLKITRLALPFSSSPAVDERESSAFPNPSSPSSFTQGLATAADPPQPFSRTSIGQRPCASISPQANTQVGGKRSAPES